MKILYLTVPSFFDLEISLIRELRKTCDVNVIMIISPQSMHSSAFSIEQIMDKVDMVRGCDYDGLKKYDKLIDLNCWWVANNPDNSIKSCLKLTRKIKSFIKKGSYDLIHSTTDCKTSLFLLPFIRRCPNTLYTVHDPVPHRKSNFIRSWLAHRFLYGCYQNLLFLSNSLEDAFNAKYTGVYKKIFYSSLSKYDFLTSYEVLPNKYGKYILFFGRVDEYKGVDLIIKAFPKTEAYNQGVQLIIAGKLSPNYKLNVCNNDRIIHINRYIANDELANLIYHSLFIVLPYKSATQSGCIFSAYAFNKPVLATNVGDLPNQVDSEVGFVIKSNDINEIIRGIDYMYNSNLEIKSQMIYERYSEGGTLGWTNIAKKLAKTYQEIINGNSN